MWIFYILLLVPMMIQHFTIRKNQIDYEKKNQRALLVFFVLLAMITMLRHDSVGTDTETYMYFFRKLSAMSWREVGQYDLEIGYSYFNKAVSIFTKDPQAFLAIIAMITIGMIYHTYKRLCGDPSLTIVLFCTMSTFVMMFSGIRQMLAIGIGFIAYEFTRNKKLVPFILTVILAMCIHTSAFMLAFMYPLYRAKVTRKWLYVVIPVLLVIFAFNQPIFTVLSAIIEAYTEYEGGISSTGAYTMLILFVLLAVFAFVIPDERYIDEETIGLRNFMLLALALQMFSPLHTLAMRMNYYYIIFIPLLIPKIISCRSQTMDQIAVVGRHVMVVFFLVYFFMNAYTGDNLDVFPYRFFWESAL